LRFGPCAPGLLAYDRRHGFRAPLKHVDKKDDWTAELKAMPNKSGVASWRVALVTELKDEASLVLQDAVLARFPRAS